MENTGLFRKIVRERGEREWEREPADAANPIPIGCYEPAVFGRKVSLSGATMLRDAQAHPERYETLQVRVCDWNARFNDLSSESQATFIAQAETLN